MTLYSRFFAIFFHQEITMISFHLVEGKAEAQ